MYSLGTPAEAGSTAAVSAKTPSPASAFVTGLLAFLTVVDLFATQAILPFLAKAYHVGPAAMGTAVNSSTLGMMLASMGVAVLGRGIDSRLGVTICLTLLSVPTTLLASAPDLATFTLLRVVQGMLMATAFALTLAHLSQAHSGSASATAVAAYITGNVASNLFGRMLSASAAEILGLAASFYVFAALNLAGAALAWLSITHRAPDLQVSPATTPAIAIVRSCLADRRLRSAFGIGFCILFAFIGTFTYVNFVLVRPPLSLGMMSVGLVYLVFLPSVLTTPFAATVALRLGTRNALWLGLAIAGAGLPLLLVPALAGVLGGLILVGAGTFLAQAIAAGFVGRTAPSGTATASGIYLACYFLGGSTGSALLGALFERSGWAACVAGIGCSLLGAALMARNLTIR